MIVRERRPFDRVRSRGGRTPALPGCRYAAVRRSVRALELALFVALLLLGGVLPTAFSRLLGWSLLLTALLTTLLLVALLLIALLPAALL